MIPIEKLQLVIAFALLVGLVGSFELGFRMGRRRARDRAPSGGTLGAVQGATLGLLGLLLGFSFAGAAGRFMERQDLILTEANAIGTAYLRADVVEEPHRSDLRRALAEYTRSRVAMSRDLIGGFSESMRAEIDAYHARMWAAAVAGVDESPGTIMAVLPPVNEVIDLHASRLAAGRKHLPMLVLGLLLVCSALAMHEIGYGCGEAGRRALPMTLSLAVVVAAALWATIDLDYPRAGLIRLSDRPLEELRFEGAP